MKTANRFCSVLVLALMLALAASAGAANARPNIVFILVDDLGWTDLHCFGSKFYETPNIDRLCAQGMKFTDAYSACTVCSPTRASILTGRYPARLHITDWIAGHERPFAKLRIPDWQKHLPLETMNMARALKSAGYATASIGKWHLGGPEFWPDKQGFDLNIAGCDKGQPPSYFSPYRIPTLTDGPEGEFLSDRLTAEAVKFISDNKERPFFLYLPHYAVHTPLMAKPGVVAKYKAKADPSAPQHNATYAGLIESVDDSVGVLLRTLDELKLTGNTLIIFTSDNGGLMLPLREPVTCNAPLRAGKGSAYEGGVRVPLIVKWPGVTRPGSVCRTPVISADYFPTLLEAAASRNDATVDGESIVPLLKQSGPLRRDAIYWHYPHYHPGGATPYSAVREGDWRLVEFLEDNRVELYNLKDDLSEATDLSAKQPDKAAALRRKLHEWRERVGAQMPSPNPNADAAKDKPPARKGKGRADSKQQSERTAELERVAVES